MPPVPTTSQVNPGASVSIVLKADQRTGRQVQGKVQDVLTRGNHPRGIKVRLVDGRIGRVQGMAISSGDASSSSSTSASTAGAAGVGGAVEDEEARQSEIQRDLAIQQRVRGPDRGGRFQHKYTDVRLDEAAEQPPEQLDLMAFVKQPRHQQQQKKKNKGGSANKTSTPFPFADSAALTASREQQPPSELFRALDVVQTAVVKCPVCGLFEGDEAAVAHHVEGHFT